MNKSFDNIKGLQREIKETEKISEKFYQIAKSVGLFGTGMTIGSGISYMADSENTVAMSLLLASMGVEIASLLINRKSVMKDEEAQELKSKERTLIDEQLEENKEFKNYVSTIDDFYREK